MMNKNSLRIYFTRGSIASSIIDQIKHGLLDSYVFSLLMGFWVSPILKYSQAISSIMKKTGNFENKYKLCNEK